MLAYTAPYMWYLSDTNRKINAMNDCQVYILAIVIKTALHASAS